MKKLISVFLLFIINVSFSQSIRFYGIDVSKFNEIENWIINSEKENSYSLEDVGYFDVVWLTYDESYDFVMTNPSAMKFSEILEFFNKNNFFMTTNKDYIPDFVKKDFDLDLIASLVKLGEAKIHRTYIKTIYDENNIVRKLYGEIRWDEKRLDVFFHNIKD